MSTSNSNPMLPSFVKIPDSSLKNTEEGRESLPPSCEDSVRKKIEIFESQRKRKADDSSRGSPEQTPCVRKVARKRPLKKKMSSTQEMIARMNINMMREFRKMNEQMSHSNEKILENEKMRKLQRKTKKK